MRVVWLVAVLSVDALVAACTKPNPAVCCTTAADCEAKGLPLGKTCELGLVCVNNACTAPTTCQAMSDCEAPTPLCDVAGGTCVECLAEDDCAPQICDTTAHACRPCTSNDECTTGYCDTNIGECKAGILTPLYLPTVCDAPGTTSLDLGGAQSVSTTDDATCSGGVVVQSGGPDICVIRHTTLTVSGSVRLSGQRAVALVADGDLVVAGTIDASADGSTDGPGGGTTTSGTFSGGVAGGGGAGHKTSGGSGNGATNGGAAMNGLLAPVLVGGPAPDAGGGGGGAVTLISCSGAVRVSGSIDVGGGGGFAGRYAPNQSASLGGAGGGAGGVIVLQGRSIEVTGSLFANGGSGGGGKTDCRTDLSNCVGMPGTDALAAATCAAGPPVNNGGGAGGDGGCAAAAPKNGGPPTSPTINSMPTGGGGGGSTGFIRLATPEGGTIILTPASVSPTVEATEMLDRH